MKFRRFLAIMMTVLMLIGMMPTAMAEACNHFNAVITDTGFDMDYYGNMTLHFVPAE